MGCGKSSVGRKLSELLCCPFMDLDKDIEAAAGKRIPEIFAEDGEEAFRSLEADRLSAALALSDSKAAGPSPYPGMEKCQFRTTVSPQVPQLCANAMNEGEIKVLSLGGGTVVGKECAEMVKEKTLCIYLKASVETLVSHLEGETADRPMLQGESLRERISSLMTQRSAIYEETAHIIIDTDGKSIDEIAVEIISKAH